MTAQMSRPGSPGVDPESPFTVRAYWDDPHYIVELWGELDLSNAAAAIEACSAADHLDVLVDLSGLTFMDGAGYGALAAATTLLERRGGSMVLMNPVGAPRRLLALIEQLEQDLCAPLRYGTPPMPHAA